MERTAARRTVAQHTVEQLAAWGVRHVFGVAGDTVIPLLEALRQRPDVTFVPVRHEESAGFMASAYAKLTGRVGVCLAEAGPAAVHLLAGVYDAHMDRVPVLALTGESPTERLGTHWPQTIDQQLLYAGATGFNHTLASERQLPEMLYQALRDAEIRAGASRLGLPVDLQLKPVEGPVRARPGYLDAVPAPDPAALEQAARMLAGAERPLIFVGQGARGQGAAVVRLADRLGAAIIHTLPAKDVVPPDHPRNLGVVGQFGTEPAAEAFGEADVVLVVGSTWWQPDYVPAARFIQIDRRLRHVDLLFPVDVGLVGDAAQVLPRLVDVLDGMPSRGRDRWVRRVEELKASWERDRRRGDAAAASDHPLDGTGGAAANGRARRAGQVAPQQVVAALQQRLPADAVVCLDVGDNTFWMSALFDAGAGRRVLVSGHWRCMGFGLPAAVAAGIAAPGRPVVAVVGDGGFAMTMAEFATAVALGVPVVVVVLNNGVLAEEGHKQVQMRLEPFGIRLHNPDFAAYAEACGGRGFRVQSPGELDQALAAALGAGRPAIVDVATRPVRPAWPRPRGSLRPAASAGSGLGSQEAVHAVPDGPQQARGAAASPSGHSLRTFPPVWTR